MEQNTVIHDRAYMRKMNWHKAIRKRRIVHQYGYEFYDNLHQYSKNKIHCSCPMCKKNANWGLYTNAEGLLKIADRRKIDSLQEQLLDLTS